MPCCGLRRRYDAAGVASWMLSDSWLAASRQSRERLVSELADLTYHMLVLLAEFDLTPDEVFAELERRHR